MMQSAASSLQPPLPLDAAPFHNVYNPLPVVRSPLSTIGIGIGRQCQPDSLVSRSDAQCNNVETDR